jgi:tetratricopeptide (TPR) repeat protein
MRDKSVHSASHLRHSFSTLHRWVMTLLLVAAFCSVAAAQTERIGSIRERGPHTLYGDIKIETEPGNESQKPLGLEVQLYIINGTLVGRETIPGGGRYRFMDLANGEYELVVLQENKEVARVPVRVQAVYKNDFRQDIVLEAHTDHPTNRTATISASDTYERTGPNKSLFEKSQKALDEKKYDEAADLLGRLVAGDAKDFQAWTELGTVHLLRNNPDEAEKAYRHAIEERPTFTLALLDLGRLLSMQKKFEAAIEPLTEAIKSSPTSADANFLLGEAYLQIKKGSKAVPYLTEAAKLGKPDAHLRLAALYNGAGMKDKAALEYEQFLKERPDYKDRKVLEQYISANKKP